ncbi:hypothetical protein [Pseudomonas sp. PLMAX]|uniref:hypothetical protein n=1 Tax=Pseudomonas sp. PLMAX TaxID=2201998 RepID=UPI0038BBD13D
MTITMKTNEAMKQIIDTLSGRKEAMDWSDVVIEPVDKRATSVDPTNCLYWAFVMERVLHGNFLIAKPQLNKPLCDVFRNVLDTTPSDCQKEFAKSFISLGVRFVGIQARNGDELGCQKEAIEVFKLLQAQIEQYNPEIDSYNVKDMTSFVVSNIGQMEQKDLQQFLSYGAMYTHLIQQHGYQRDQQSFMFERGREATELPALTMNQALASVFRGTFGDSGVFIREVDHLPDREFAQNLLSLCDQLFRLEYDGAYIPGCQLIDQLLVAQAITAISRAYSHTDDSAARARYERGVGALVDLTMKPATQKLTAGASPYAPTAHSKKMLTPGESRPVLDEIIKEAQDRPATGSATIESAALRFNRQVFLELAFRAPKSEHFNTPVGKGQLKALADLARDGLRTREHFSHLGKPQKLWLTMHSDDEKTKMTLLENNPELRKDTFIHELNI